MRDLREVANKFKGKLSKIKCVAFDNDGILTTGHVRFDSEEMGWNRSFHTSDGYGLLVLKRAGLKVGVISGGKSIGLSKRFEENLDLDFTFFGDEDKRVAYTKLLDMGFKDEEILYMGDEFFDLPLLKRCGFSATVPHASHEIQEGVDYVTERQAGFAAAREVIDILRYAQGITPQIPDFDS
ncbi:MAG: HAD hydrolase family protein [Bacteriovoracaceae bacterium]|nr:HAD hydrolase family protein [Bacteriovoracaceae bacterium]